MVGGSGRRSRARSAGVSASPVIGSTRRHMVMAARAAHVTRCFAVRALCKLVRAIPSQCVAVRAGGNRRGGTMSRQAGGDGAEKRGAPEENQRVGLAGRGRHILLCRASS